MPKSKVLKVNTDSDLEQLRQRVTAFCTEAGYQLSPQADAILRDIVNMKQQFGDYYCSCQPQRLPETVCVCQPVRNGLVKLMGSCFCDLILSNNKDKE